jgi:ubiquitin conjugation factor E4 B
MKDPVRLPSSGAILDRATIKSHLLSDAKDPFNRVPLTIEDVTPGKSHNKFFLLTKKKTSR